LRSRDGATDASSDTTAGDGDSFELWSNIRQYDIDARNQFREAT